MRTRRFATNERAATTRTDEQPPERVRYLEALDGQAMGGVTAIELVFLDKVLAPQWILEAAARFPARATRGGASRYATLEA